MSYTLQGDGQVFHGESQVATAIYTILVDESGSLPSATGTLIVAPRASLAMLGGEMLRLRLEDGRTAGFFWTNYAVDSGVCRIRVSGPIE